MHRFQTHLRNTFLAGIFAVIPVAVTIFLIYKVDEATRGLSKYVFGKPLPFVGMVLALILIYVSGLIVTISLGRWILGIVDSIISRIPLLKTGYAAWKQISLTPGGGEGMFAKVVLIPDETGALRMVGFTSGDVLPNDPEHCCVFVPGAPNPVQGRLYFVKRANMKVTSLSSEEAFKFLLSTGNYVPMELGGAAQPG